MSAGKKKPGIVVCLNVPPNPQAVMEQLNLAFVIGSLSSAGIGVVSATLA